MSDDIQRDREGRRALIRALVATVGCVVVAAYVLAFVPRDRRFVVQLALTAIGVIAVATAVGALRRAAALAPRSPFDRKPAVERSEPVPVPAELVRITRCLAAAEATAADARRDLGPIVAAIATDRLRRAAHAPIEPETVYSHLPRPVPAALAMVLDPALASLDTRAMPGIDADGVEALVRALEQL
jgi:hypothetical protein